MNRRNYVPPTPIKINHGVYRFPVDVYAYYDAAGVLLYIGQSYDLRTREGAHRLNAPWWPDVAERRILSTHATRRAALDAEAAAIRTLMPLHNITHNLRVSA